ncbi:MAG: helix-turn-helix transcriptional regulator [Fretibacterium sp.]|nr:helix-turn-helix transcriptional regulator [Fretibacterium sp.]
MFDVKPLIQKLLRYGERLEITQKEFAQHLGVSSPVVSKWRKGHGGYNPTLQQLSDVAELCGTTVIELLTPDAPLPVSGEKDTTQSADKTTAQTRKTRSVKTTEPAAKSKTQGGKSKKSDATQKTSRRTSAASKPEKTAVPDKPTAETTMPEAPQKKRGRPRKSPKV